jgi:hypothetical protein
MGIVVLPSLIQQCTVTASHSTLTYSHGEVTRAQSTGSVSHSSLQHHRASFSLYLAVAVGGFGRLSDGGAAVPLLPRAEEG